MRGQCYFCNRQNIRVDVMVRPDSDTAVECCGDCWDKHCGWPYGRWVPAAEVIPPEPLVHGLIDLMQDHLEEIETEDWREN